MKQYHGPDLIWKIAHELRTPLTSIAGYTSLVAQIPGLTALPQAPPYLSQIAGGVDQLKNLLDNFQLLYQLDQKTINIKEQELYITPEWLNEITLDYQQKALAKGLVWQADIEAEPLKIISDPQLLKIILANILANALRFTAQGTITITAKRLAHGIIQLAIIDQGPGIARHDQPQVFQRFFKGNNNAGQHQYYPGLGLAIAKELAELLSINLVLESKWRQSTKVSLFFDR